MRIFIGYDPRDDLAYRVCEASLREKSSTPLEIVPLKEWELRKRGLFWRTYRVETGPGGGMQMTDDRDGKPFSTQFSFTRFCVPMLESFDSDFAMFVDADFMFRSDINLLFDEVKAQAEADKDLAIWCVKHAHRPVETVKMDGVKQEVYHRKNWSSLYVCRPWKCQNQLSRYQVNQSTGSQLHAFTGFLDQEIGELDESWNYLDGYSDPEIEPDAVHFTRGTPDMNVPSDYADEWWNIAKRV